MRFKFPAKKNISLFFLVFECTYLAVSAPEARGRPTGIQRSDASWLFLFFFFLFFLFCLYFRTFSLLSHFFSLLSPRERRGGEKPSLKFLWSLFKDKYIFLRCWNFPVLLLEKRAFPLWRIQPLMFSSVRRDDDMSQILFSLYRKYISSLSRAPLSPANGPEPSLALFFLLISPFFPCTSIFLLFLSFFLSSSSWITRWIPLSQQVRSQTSFTR